MSFLFPFADPRTTDPRVGGGKGTNLALLTQRGFPVPPGIVVSPDAYRAFAAPATVHIAALHDLDADDLAGTRAASERLLARLSTLPIPEEVANGIRAWHGEHGEGHAFAVRSSGTMEDTAGAAFAGQHDTFLNCVGVDALLDRLRACWCSLWHERAIAYRTRMGFDHREVAMAVVIQRMAQSEVAGVAFGIDPVTGALDRVMVNANFGLGESVVSGEGEVDHFVLDKGTGAPLETRIARKRSRVIADVQGTREAEVGEADADRPSLAEADLARIARLVRDVEAGYGWPQDIEWGIEHGTLWLLQSRPITTIPPRWTRDESAERFPNPVTPFTWDFVESGFHQSLNHSFALMGLPRYDGKWFALFDSYVYGNQNAVELYARRSPVSVARLAELEALLPGLLERFAWITALPARWHAALPAYLSAIAAFMEEPLDPMDIPGLWDYIERVNGIGTRYFLPNIAISLGHGLLHRGVHALAVLAVGEAEAERLVPALLATETMTSHVNAELRELAGIARSDVALAARLHAEPARTLLADASAAGDHPFWRAFRAFVQEHGHRETDFDAYHPTWREAPWVVLDHVRAMLDAAPRDQRGPVDGAAARDGAERALQAGVPDGMRDFVLAVVRLAREYTALDDLEHYHTTRLALPLRRGVRALGERLAALGVVDDPLDVFFAHKEAAASAVAAGDRARWKSLGAEIARAKDEYAAARARTPRWALDDRAEEQIAVDGQSLTGIAGSPGVAEGEVFVVTGVEDFPRFPRGAVLVARTTNPAWTPLFHGAAAVVTESGGPLSHGAVTAREMRIPAVMSVRGVLAALRNGDRVAVDGTRGLVVRLDPAADARAP